MTTTIILCLAFFVVAFLYASVGFGGGSSYIAILSLAVFALSFPVIRSTALFCNLIVVTGGCWIYYRSGQLLWRDFWPFLFSVPASFLGGAWPIREQTFFMLLGGTLVVVSLLLWFQPEQSATRASVSDRWPVRAGLGTAIGFLSGMVGIGGGIFLSPVMHFFRWADSRRIAAVASAFILVNSISGLAGQFQRGIPDFSTSFVFPLLVSVLAGGQLGTRLGTTRLKVTVIKRITAALILVAGLNILRDHWLH